MTAFLDLEPSQPTPEQISNAFQPSAEIVRPEKFAGRIKELEQAYEALISSGVNLAILGDAGIGKTSLARQIINIAKGDDSVFLPLGLRQHRQLNYITMYFTCVAGTRNLEDLLEGLLTSEECLGAYPYDILTDTKRSSTAAPKFSAGIGKLEVSLGLESKREDTSTALYRSHSPETAFLNKLSEIAARCVDKAGVLIVIDEFNRLENALGIGPLLKSLAHRVPGVKVCLVGVASDLDVLVRDHSSVHRMFTDSVIQLQSLNNAEMEDVILKAERSLGRYIIFDETAKAKMIHVSHGQPYMLHMIGKHSLKEADRTGARVVTANLVELGLQCIADKKSDRILDERYSTAVGNSEEQEAVLKALASNLKRNGEIDIDRAFALALLSGADYPHVCMNKLTKEAFGEEVQATGSNSYRFRDALFAAYAHARPSMFSRSLI